MAIDPRIPLQSQPVDIRQAFQAPVQGALALNQIRQMPLQNEAMRLANETRSIQNQAATNQQQINAAIQLGRVADLALTNENPEAFFKKVAPQLQDMGIKVDKLMQGDTREGLQMASNLGKALSKIGEGETVRSTQVYQNGAVQMVTDKGPKVFSPDGRQVSGEEAQEVIQEANDFETERQQQRSFARGQGAARAEKLDAIFDQVGNIRQNLRLYDEAIDAVEAGAVSGPIASRFPSLRSASIKLDNVRQRLGLTTIAGANFGALSEAELSLALEVEIPNLPPEQMVPYLRRKKAAQEKLAQELTESAAFLEQGGTLGELLEMKVSDSGGQGGDQGQQGQEMSAQDRQAMEWARQNPDDPRARRIMQMLGGQ